MFMSDCIGEHCPIKRSILPLTCRYILLLFNPLNCATILPQTVTGKGKRNPLSRRGFFPCLFPSSSPSSPNDLSYPVMAPTKKQISPRQREATAASWGYLVHIKRFRRDWGTELPFTRPHAPQTGCKVRSLHINPIVHFFNI